MRQRSMADITFIWSRLTCPTLARRHAAPWSRKISATSKAGRDMAPLCRRLVFAALPGLLARLRQQVERALDAGDHAGGDARVARRRIQFVVTKQRLDDSDIGTAIEQMSCKAVPKRVQCHGLLDSGRIGRFVEQAAQLAGAHRLAALGTWKQPTFLRRRSGIMTRWAHLPPLAQQVERLGRQHDIAVLASLGLLHPHDLLCAVDVLDLEPDHLAGTQAAAIAEAEQYAHLEAAGDREQAARLVLAHHQRNLLRLAEVINLGRKVRPPQCYAEQELHPGHDAVAIADAHARLGQVQLETTNVIRCGHIGRTLQKCSETPAAVDVTSLRVCTEFARVHVLYHALAQRGDGVRTHGKLLSWVRSKHLDPQDRPHGPLSTISQLGTAPAAGPPRSGLSRSDLVPWPTAAFAAV